MYFQRTRPLLSVYFYLLYLTVEYDDAGLNLITFLPQVILLLVIALRLNRLHDVNFSLFCQTLVFVTFNKVVTAQYFLWYFSLLPLVLPHLGFSLKDILLGKISILNPSEKMLNYFPRLHVVGVRPKLVAAACLYAGVQG